MKGGEKINMCQNLLTLVHIPHWFTTPTMMLLISLEEEEEESVDKLA